MPNYFIYRMNHDTGFAPHIEYGVCTISGCKNAKTPDRRNIEELARRGDWLIGIGGNNTGKGDRLIYVMEVENNFLYDEFVRHYPQESTYLTRKTAGTNVLVSRNFYYFGSNALEVPENLAYKYRKYKYLEADDFQQLQQVIHSKGYKKAGVYGQPNNYYQNDKLKIFS